jgi:mannosyltransferase
VITLLGLTGLPGQLAVRGPTAKNGSDYRTAATIIRHDQMPGDAIVYQTGSLPCSSCNRGCTLRAGVHYYLRRDPGRPRDVLLVRSAGDIGGLRAQEATDPVPRLSCAGRMWLLVNGHRGDPAVVRRDMTAYLQNRCRRVRIWHVKDATLALYVRKD